MKKISLFVFGAFAWVSSAGARPLQLVVMDPLSKDLACACVKGYAQRNYKVLAAHLQNQTGQEVQVVHGETLADALKHSGGKADIIVGKTSVIQSEAKKNALDLDLVASLTGKDGSPFQRGLLVVRKDSPARKLADLRGARFLFGPEDCEEK
jgi:ABC-type phosphate/phosphonate transport system substrate-binding protein